MIFLKTGKHSDFRISSFQVVDVWRILQFNGKTEKYFKEFIWFFFCRGEGAATRWLPYLRYGSHYLEVEICHRWTLLSATRSFQAGKNFENRQKHQKRRSAWVGQADFGKFELNNIRKNSGNSQRLSVVNVINLKHDQLETEAYMLLFRPSRFRGRTRELLSLAILRLLRKHSNKQTFSCRGRESWNAALRASALRKLKNSYRLVAMKWRNHPVEYPSPRPFCGQLPQRS